ncbi:zinc finger CCCH domain-containing protein 32 [Cajanus cajan]|uniref:zinc finger CCCH domain-containing protein 32 n=1 Tax=Cajanus cajan TaxID=3821 RepID=UPI0010FB6FC1|nr:zinc finger CCCH domain-containing protein 32 [Cajanus cajan]
MQLRRPKSERGEKLIKKEKPHIPYSPSERESTLCTVKLLLRLSESMWHLTLNCVYYMRTGACGYGSRCRYNHPRDRAEVAARVRAIGDYSERVGEPPCQTGTCKFAASCKFHHPKNGGGYLSQAPLNVYGYPLQPCVVKPYILFKQGEKECSYYLKTGQCKFGITCKFHHPQPADASLPASAPQFYQQVQSPTIPLPEQYGGASTSLRVARPFVLSGSYVQGAYGPILLSPGVVPFPGWSHYSVRETCVRLCPVAGATSLYGVTQLSSPTSAFARPYTPLSSTIGPSGNSLKNQLFPERLGEPECQYYLKTGDCKFGLACRYYHPRDHIVARPLLSPIGLPLRPFGSTCKFDHPLGSMRYSPSVSSLIEVPITPYPVGSLLPHLASSTSSELWFELISGSKKESHSARIPFGNSSATSVGLIFSQSGSGSLSDVQLSSQSSAPLSNSRSTRQSDEIR